MANNIICLLLGVVYGGCLSMVTLFAVLEHQTDKKNTPPTKEEWKVMDYEN